MRCSRCSGRSQPERHPILLLGRRRREAVRLVPPTHSSFSVFLPLVPEPGSVRPPSRTLPPPPRPTPHLGRPELPWVRGRGASIHGKDQPCASAGGRVVRTPRAPGMGSAVWARTQGGRRSCGEGLRRRKRAVVREDPREEGRERREGGEAREKWSWEEKAAEGGDWCFCFLLPLLPSRWELSRREGSGEMIAELVSSALGLALYLNTLSADFCYDDR